MSDRLTGWPSCETFELNLYHHVLKCERFRGVLLHLISQSKSTPRTRVVNAEQQISLLDGVVESRSANSGGARTNE
jgi:hypothetical protein